MLGRYRDILSRPSFRRFWLGFTLSEVGDVVTRVALTWYVYDRTRSPAALGWLAFWYTGPVIVGGLVAGKLLDRFDRPRVMMADNVLRGLAVALIPLLHALGALAIWHIYAVAAVYGLLMMISLAGGPSLIPSLVDEGQIPTANALETVTFTLAGIVGPVLAGQGIRWVSAPTVMLVDAASYFVFVIILARLRVARPVAGDREAEPSPPPRLGDAVRLSMADPILRSTTLMFMLFNIGGGLLAVWLPILADRALGGGSQLYGWLLGAMALGEVVGAVVVGSRTFAAPLGTLICLGQIAAGAALALVLDRRLWPVTLGLLLFGAFSAPLTVWAQTLRMHIIPERMRGRMFALLRMVMQSGAPIGGLIAGVLLPLVGLTAMVAGSALLVVVPGLVGARVRALRAAGAPVANQAVRDSRVTRR